MSLVSIILILILGNCIVAQVPMLQPSTMEQPPLNITNRGILFDYVHRGSGELITPGYYAFTTFSISYKDSVLHASRSEPIDNVVFIPLEFNKNPNAAIYELFTYLRAGDKVFFDIPFRMLPWKDAVLSDTDSIRYVLAIDSVKNDIEYGLFYENYLIQEEAKLDKNAEWFLALKTDVKQLLYLFDQKDRNSGFYRHPSGYWYNILRKGEGKISEKGKLRYALYFKEDTQWNDLYFTPTVIETGSGTSQIHYFLEDIIKNMKIGQREIVIIPAAMARDVGLHSNGVNGDLCFYLEWLAIEN
jgi:hypothetical protein